MTGEIVIWKNRIIVCLLVTVAMASSAVPAKAEPGVVMNTAAAKASALEAGAVLAAGAEAPAAERPGGVALAPDPVDMGALTSRLGASSCAWDAKALQSGKINSYRCVSVSTQTGAAARGDTAAEQRASDENVAEAMASASMNGEAVAAACSTTTSKTYRWTATSRTTGCAHSRFTIKVTLEPDGKVVGESTVHVVMTMSAEPGRARMANTAYLWVWTAWGEGAPHSTTGDIVTWCGDTSCQPTSPRWGPAAEAGAWEGSTNVDMAVAKGAKATTTGSFWTFTLSRAGWSNVLFWYVDLGTARCDNAISKRPAGCVIPAFWPTWTIPTRAYPQFTSHVDSALTSGLPGKKSSKNYLTRLRDKSKAEQNGRAACPSRLKRPEGYSCDEFPFRSTYQGAFTGNKAADRKARSFPGCQMDDPKRTGQKGFSRCFIPEGQNSGAGAVLGNWYSSERMLNNDKFWVGFSG